MTLITMPQIYGNILMFSCQKMQFEVILVSYEKIESNICAPVLLNLLNSLRKKD